MHAGIPVQRSVGNAIGTLNCMGGYISRIPFPCPPPARCTASSMQSGARSAGRGVNQRAGERAPLLHMPCPQAAPLPRLRLSSGADDAHIACQKTPSILHPMCARCRLGADPPLLPVHTGCMVLAFACILANPPLTLCIPITTACLLKQELYACIAEKLTSQREICP